MASPTVLAPGSLDEPILLLRDEVGGLKGFSNVCTHRGHILVDGSRRSVKTLQCPYHGRCFGLDGRVVRSPGFGRYRCDDAGAASLGTGRPMGTSDLRLAQPEQSFRGLVGGAPRASGVLAGRNVGSCGSHDIRHRRALDDVRRKLPRGSTHPFRPSFAGKSGRLAGLPVPPAVAGEPAGGRIRRGGGFYASRRTSRLRMSSRGLLFLAVPDHDAEHLPLGTVPQYRRAAGDESDQGGFRVIRGGSCPQK